MRDDCRSAGWVYCPYRDVRERKVVQAVGDEMQRQEEVNEEKMGCKDTT
jgi:hypothetical protein